MDARPTRVAAVGVLILGLLQPQPHCARAAASDGSPPAEPPVRTDRERCDPFALRVEDLVAAGHPQSVAEEIAAGEFDDGSGVD